MDDPKKAKQWQKNVVNEKIIHQTSNFFGTRFKEVIEENGKKLEMIGEITEYEKNFKISFHIKSKIHEFDVSYTLEGFENKTKLLIALDIKWKFPMNIISLFIGSKIKKNMIQQISSEVSELKNLV